MSKPDKVRIGKIVGFHGVRGDVKVRPASDDASWAGHLKRVFLRMEKPAGREEASLGEKLLHVVEMRRQGPHVLMRFDGFGNRTLVEPMMGGTLYAELADLPAPAEGEYWADDLIGLAVVDLQTGRRRGTVKDLLSSGGSDFLEIQLEESTETVVIPFTNHFFPQVSVAEGTISIDLLSDFLSLSTEPVTADRLKQ